MNVHFLCIFSFSQRWKNSKKWLIMILPSAPISWSLRRSPNLVSLLNVILGSFSNTVIFCQLRTFLFVTLLFPPFFSISFILALALVAATKLVLLLLLCLLFPKLLTTLLVQKVLSCHIFLGKRQKMIAYWFPAQTHTWTTHILKRNSGLPNVKFTAKFLSQFWYKLRVKGKVSRHVLCIF